MLCFFCPFAVFFVFSPVISGDNTTEKVKETIISWEKKKTNGCAKPIDEEHCRRPSIFLPINRLKTVVSVCFFRDGVGRRHIPALIH